MPGLLGNCFKQIKIVVKYHLNHLKIYFIYLFLERGEEKERGREISVCGCLSHAPYWRRGLACKTRHVP